MPYPFTLDDILRAKKEKNKPFGQGFSEVVSKPFNATDPEWDFSNKETVDLTPQDKNMFDAAENATLASVKEKGWGMPQSKQTDINNPELASALNRMVSPDTKLDFPAPEKTPINQDILDMLFKGTKIPTKEDISSDKFGPNDLLRSDIKPSKTESVSTKSSIKSKIKDITDTEMAKDIAKSIGLVEDTSLEDALARRDNLQGLALAAQGAQQIGAALAGTKAIEGYGQELAKYGQQGVSDITLKREHEMKQTELNRMREFNDPKSKSSDVERTMARNLLNKIGHKDVAARITDDMSAQAVKDLTGGINIQNLVQQYDANQTKLQLLEARKQAASDKSLDKKTADNMKFITSASEKLMKSKPYIAYDKSTSAREKVQAILAKGKDQTSADDIGVLYEYVKAMDPESAVREGETQLAKSGLSHFANIKNSISRFGKNPRVLTTDFISNIKNYMDISQAVYKERLDKQVNIYKHMSKQRGMTPDEMYPLDMISSPGSSVENDLGFEEGK